MQREMELQQPPVQQEMKSQKGSVIAIDPDRPEVTQLTSCCRGKQPRTNSNAWGSVMFRFDFIRTRRPTKFSRSTTFLRGACGCEVHLRLTVSRRIPTVGRFGTKRENQRLLQPRDIFHCVSPEVKFGTLIASSPQNTLINFLCCPCSCAGFCKTFEVGLFDRRIGIAGERMLTEMAAGPCGPCHASHGRPRWVFVLWYVFVRACRLLRVCRRTVPVQSAYTCAADRVPRLP